MDQVSLAFPRSNVHGTNDLSTNNSVRTGLAGLGIAEFLMAAACSSFQAQTTRLFFVSGRCSRAEHGQSKKQSRCNIDLSVEAVQTHTRSNNQVETKGKQSLRVSRRRSGLLIWCRFSRSTWCKSTSRWIRNKPLGRAHARFRRCCDEVCRVERRRSNRARRHRRSSVDG